jgi:hypothetical protein
MTFHDMKITSQRFELGRVVITRGALAHCEDKGIDYITLLMRHAAGDFGSVGHLDDVRLSRAEKQHGAYATDNGLRLNAVGILNATGMILSVYQQPKNTDDKVWIMTMLAGEETYTTVLLPEEY